ncbi:MAG: acyl-CoA dehydrogenase [Desulfurispora sp.]|uniref:acyl-CoA dehydrogenase n=1 Tax=Desulfurispora sp. TaxID=3014275 RepID=UPI004049EBB7
MSYRLSEDLEMLRRTVAKMAEDRVAPRAAEIDEQDAYPWDLKELFAEQGLLGAGVPEEYGGTGIGLPAVCLIVEEIARVSASASLIVAAQELGLMPILVGGSEEQKRKYLPALASGEQICAFGLTEPNAGSDAGSVKTRAVRQGDVYILNGQKCFITNGGIADVYTIFASTDPGKGLKGLSAFIVEKDYPGFSAGKKEKKMGIRGSQTTELILDNCPVPAANLLGKEGDGFKIAMMTLDRTRPVIGAQAVGIAQGALDYAVNYAQERVQFGKPIASFQGIQFMLADMVTRIEAARQLVYKAAFFIEEAAHGGASPAEISRFSSMAKLFASDVAMQVTVDAVQVLGGYGYMREYPLERMMRDAKITQIYEGTNQIQRLVIARTLLD